MNIKAIVAARMTSTRLPGKILMDLAGQPALVRLIERLKGSRYLQEIVIATTTNKADDPIVAIANSQGVAHFRGSEEDVMGRTLGAALATNTDLIVQVTSDCPLIDATTIDATIERMLERSYLDYVGNHLVRTYPLGFSSEVFRTSSLEEAESLTRDPADREHVSLYLYERPETYHLSNVEAPLFLRHPEYRLTLDTKEDYEVIRTIFESLYPINDKFDLFDIVRYLQHNPNLLEINSHIGQKKAR